MALDAVPGSPTANSYVTTADATLLLAERLDTAAWDDAEIADQETALIWATQILETSVRWYGTPTSTTQALWWPQTGAVDCRGRPIAPDVVPRDIQQATALYALALLEEESAGGNVSADAGIKSKKIGDTSITYKDDAQIVSVITTIPADIRRLLACYGFVPGGINVPILRT